MKRLQCLSESHAPGTRDLRYKPRVKELDCLPPRSTALDRVKDGTQTGSYCFCRAVLNHRPTFTCCARQAIEFFHTRLDRRSPGSWTWFPIALRPLHSPGEFRSLTLLVKDRRGFAGIEPSDPAINRQTINTVDRARLGISQTNTPNGDCAEKLETSRNVIIFLC